MKQYASFLFPAPELFGLLMDLNVPKVGFWAVSEYMSRRGVAYTAATGYPFPRPSPEEAETYRREMVGGKKKAKTTTNPSNPQTTPQSNQPQPTTTDPPNTVDKENKANKEQEEGDPAKGSHEP